MIEFKPQPTSSTGAGPTTSPNPRETRPQRVDFKQTVKQLLHRLGGSVSWDGELLLGTEQVYLEEEGRVVEFDKKVGSLDSVEIVVSCQTYFDDNEGMNRTKEKYVYVKEYRFGPDLKTHFPELIAAIPADQFSRILAGDDELVIRIYNSLDRQETAALQEQTQPLPNGVVGFTQGEWVLVDGSDACHQVASFGKSMDGCRYWIVYDPTKKRVAASHLDLLQDVEAVQEMVAALLQRGSAKSDLKIIGSVNTPESAQIQLKKLFPQVVFDVDEPDIIFDAQTGELSYPSSEVLTALSANEPAFERLRRDLEVRQRYQIGQVRRYCSPGL